MDLFAELRRFITETATQRELPDAILPLLQAVVDRPDKYRGQPDLLRKLLEQIGSFDLYAGVGCFCESAGVDDIKRTLQELDPSLLVSPLDRVGPL